jgi:NADH-quinone oxidoreductase subunit A
MVFVFFSFSHWFLFVFLICIFLLFVLTIVSVFFSRKVTNIEKQSPYECGFQPFEDSRIKFDVKYYLVGILYIIFDLEIMFLLPWIINFRLSNIGVFFVVSLFLIILGIGFIYEWLKGALKWS